jgi:pimeloyl-ACP methyl ester carboxylesterase
MPHLILPDGRQLEFQDFGPPDARPLLFAHSTPGSGFALQALERAAAELGLRLITWSRPGYGTSTRQPERTVAAQAAEVESILDHLGAPRCLIAGWDGGGPHALAAAALIPARIEAALTISGLAPLAANAYLLRTMHEHRQEELAAAALGETALRNYLSAHVTTALSGIPLTDTDRAALAPPTTADLFHNYQHGLTFGLDGWVDDDLALTQLWGFDLSRIGVPVHIWHGADDHQVPYAHSWLLAAAIPTATAHIEPGHGHLSLMLGHLPTMFAALMQDAR